MSHYYGMDPVTHEVYPVDDVHEWARQFEDSDRIISQDYVGAIKVSTVFLGLDHRILGGPPMLFETMLFGEDAPEFETRYSTYEQAAAGHVEIVKRLMTGQDIYADDDYP